MKVIEGRAWVFGDDINTDVMAPGLYFKSSMDVMARHCLEAVDPAFASGVRPGDIIVAGRNNEVMGKASYVNITATRVTGGTAFYSVVMPELAGSAEVYLPDHPDAQNLWQMKFARNCNGELFCYELTEDQIHIGGLVAFLVRAYLDPATGTSPKVFPLEESELVFPRVIKIGCKSGCD